MKLPGFDSVRRTLLTRQGVLIAGLLLLAGCAESDAPPTVGSVPQPEPSTVTLEVQSPVETDKLIASHQGKIVVVDLWTLW
jgi:hypothetical protein